MVLPPFSIMKETIWWMKMMYPRQMTVLSLCSHVGGCNASSLKGSMAGLNLSIHHEIFC